MASANVMLVIAGPCQIESRDHCLRMAESLVKITDDLKMPFIFKASYDKANRTRHDSPRGEGFSQGLVTLAAIQTSLGCRVTTDVHCLSELAGQRAMCNPPRTWVDVIQIPALLSRQTDLIQGIAAKTNTINIKKGQFMAPVDVKYAVAKAKAANARCEVMVTERGTSFGYHDIIVDFRGLVELQNVGADKVIFDASHSCQLPSSGQGVSGGQRHMIEPLARAALAIGVDGIFVEVHDDPDNALSDGETSYPLADFKELLKRLKDFHALERCYHHSSKIGQQQVA